MELPTFEVTQGPWFGPTSRAKDLLEQRTHVLPPEDALAELIDLLGEQSSGIQHVRFVDTFRTDLKQRLTIALVWTRSNPVLRQAIFDSGSRAVSATGWYPLIAGTRLGSVIEVRETLRSTRRYARLPSVRGSIEGISRAVKSDGGTSIRITTSAGESILLDTGLPDRLQVDRNDRLALLSHAHADHAGGVEALRLDRVPVLMTSQTAFVLERASWVPFDLDDASVFTTEPRNLESLGPQLMAEAIPVPHSPGSVGWIVTDDHRALIYTGDIAIRSWRHDFLDALLETVREQSKRREVTVLLDATMCGRSAGVGTGHPAPEILDHIEGDLVVLGSADHLTYAYLDLFDHVQSTSLRHSISFLATASIRPLIKILHEAWISRRHDQMDTLLAAQYGRRMPAWGESHSLYWLDDVDVLPSGRRIWLLQPGEVERWSPGPLDAVTIGGAVVEDGWGLTDRSDELDTTPWTAHTASGDLQDAIAQLDQAGATVILFHDFPNRMRKFVRSHAVPAIPLDKKISLTHR